jgi:predicted acyl esterase
MKAQLLTPSVDSIPARDSKKLAVDIYLPDTTGGITYPTILVQTPYNRQWYRFGLPLVGIDLANSPFAFVVLDWRCFYGSASACVASPDRGKDGYDAVEWIASQTWSDGQIATWGPSALGRVQYMTAKEKPPHLVCAVPLVAGPQYSYEEYFPGGVARTEYIEQLDGLGFGMSPILYANVHYNFSWSYSELTTFYPDSINIPMFMIGGWYDHTPMPMIDFFNGLRTSSPISVRNKHKLLMGPWVHGGHGAAYVGSDSAGALTYPMATGASDSLALMFLKYHLLGSTNGWDTLSAIINFQVGENQWQHLNSWPQSGLAETNIYLRSNGSLDANMSSLANDSLNLDYDPRNPSPTIGGPTLRADLLQGPYDQAPLVESRSDVLVFTSPVLTNNVRMQGYPKAVLYVSSDCKDTDFAIRITDVYPDGRSMILLDGIRRARFRNGFATTDTVFMQNGMVYPIEIETNPTSFTFLAGHRIRVDVSSSNYPRFNANMNDGGTMYVDGDTTVAHNIIYCSSTYPSHVVLPIDIFAVSLSEKNTTKLIAYPNPCTDWLTVELPEVFRNRLLTIQIIDASGRLIFNENRFVANQLILETAQLKTGSYTITIETGSEKGSLTIIR